MIQSNLQRNAFATCGQRAQTQSRLRQDELAKLVARLGFSPAELSQIKMYMSHNAEITINIQPSKQLDNQTQLIDVLTPSDHYKNGYEVGFSGGAPVTPDPKNARNLLEQAFFGYPAFPQNATMQDYGERPKYGALNIFTYATGGATGSSYGNSALVLKPAINVAATLVCNDTFAIANANQIGTFQDFDHVLMTAYESNTNDRDSKFKEWLAEVLSQAQSRRQPGLSVRSYWELQFHATVELPADVSYIRASFLQDFDTQVRDKLVAWCEKNHWPLAWALNRDQMLLQPTNEMLGQNSQLFEYLTPFLDTWIAVEQKTKRTRSDWDALWSKAPPSVRYQPELEQVRPRQPILKALGQLLRK